MGRASWTRAGREWVGKVFFLFFFFGLLVFVGVVGDADFGAWIRSILLLILRLVRLV